MTQEQLARAAGEVAFRHNEVITVRVNFAEAWSIFGLLQLALRHPGITPSLQKTGVEFARALQGQIADTAELQQIAEAGWNPAEDR